MIGVNAGEQDIPEKPAANGENEADNYQDRLVMHLQKPITMVSQYARLPQHWTGEILL
jgi:hypothetical protein